MAEITTKITPLPRVAGRFDTDFIETAEKFLNQLPDTCVEMNNFASQANSLKDEVNTLRSQTQDYKNLAYGYKVDAEQARNEIKGYVIPTDATFSKDELNAYFDEIARVQVAQQLAIALITNN